MAEKDRLSELNAYLKGANIGVQVRQKGNRLYLRATLPPKPGSGKAEPHQQEISLGIYANPAGFKRAKAEAIAVGGLLACKEFSWTPYLKEEVKPKTVRSCKEWAEEFEKDYFTRRARTPKSETTYQEYRYTFNKLPPDEALTAELILKTITASAPDTRARKRYCMVLGQLAKLAEIEIDVQPYVGSYSRAQLTPRDLPDDETIAQWRDKIKNPAWKWAYGAIAAYGLRPHEVFLLDIEKLRQGDKVLSILDGKTGARRVWPFHLEWWENWELWEIELPSVTARKHADYGNRVQQFFKRTGLPFRPYDLRHAWAVRTLEYGLDLTLASQQMGHSVAIHTQIYHHWISEKTHQKAYDALMQKRRIATP